MLARRPPRSYRGHNNPAHHATIAPAELYTCHIWNAISREALASHPPSRRMHYVCRGYRQSSQSPTSTALIDAVNNAEAGPPAINKNAVTFGHALVGDHVGDCKSLLTAMWTLALPFVFVSARGKDV